jgi:hypothetical protein
MSNKNPSTTFDITNHYTPTGEHPEDRIFRDREFVQRMEKVQSDTFDQLSKDLNLNEKGESFLFDYVHNCDEEVSFEEYLETCGLEYKDCIR